MRATIEVTVTLKFKADVQNQPDAETLRCILQHAVDSEVEATLVGPYTVHGKQLKPEVVVASAIPFVNFNW